MSTKTVRACSISVLVGLITFLGVWGSAYAEPTNNVLPSNLPCIQQDDLQVALQTFQRSCATLVPMSYDALASQRLNFPAPQAKLRKACIANTELLLAGVDKSAQLAFLDQYFVAQKLMPSNGVSMLTAYYEPSFAISFSAIKGSTDWPVYGVPSAMSERPWFTRAEIESGQVDATLLPPVLFYTTRWSAFVLQVQGSGIGITPEGKSVPVVFAGRNHRPYASIGKVLVARGEMALADISMQRIGDWLATKPQAMQDELYWQNPSFIFFKLQPLIAGEERVGPPGALNLAAGLTPGRSVAVDWAHHVPGLPLFMVATLGNGEKINRLVIVQDRGAAINSRVRVDLFSGNGADAADIAGTTRDDQLQLWALRLR